MLYRNFFDSLYFNPYFAPFALAQPLVLCSVEMHDTSMLYSVSYA